jgi:hypothetical protein
MAQLLNRQIWGVQDNADRQAGAIAPLELAEITEIYPHTDIYPSNKAYMVVDLKIKDLKALPTTEAEYCRYKKIYVVQRGIGNLWGDAWMPRQGDVVVIQRVKNSDAILVMGQLYNEAQEPVVTSYDTDYYISKVNKWIQHEQPQKWPNGTSAYKNFLPSEYYPPSGRDHTTNQPVCEKIFSKNRDCMQVYGCDHGYQGKDPWCKDCIRTGYIERPEVAIIRTNSKETTNQDGSARDPTKPKYEKARRFQIMHHNGGQMTWDEDGNLLLQNATLSGTTSTDRGHIQFTPTGQVHAKSTPDSNTTDGSQWVVYATSDSDSDAWGSVGAELKNIESGGRIRLYKDGGILVHAATTVGAAEKAYIYLAADGSALVSNSTNTATVSIGTTGDITINSPTLISLTAPEIDLNGVVYT